MRSNHSFLAQRDVTHEVAVDFVAEAGLIARCDRAPRRNFDGGRYDVALPVTIARRDVARKREVWQRRESAVMGAANAGFQHASTPYRDAGVFARVMHALGLPE